MRAFYALLLILTAVTFAIAQGPGPIPPNGAIISNSTSAATGTSTLRTQAARNAVVINVLDNGAYGDTQADGGSTVSITSGLNTLTVSNNDFVSTDVGKTIIVEGAGTPLSTGQITAVAVASHGTGYTTVPTVSFGSVGSGVGASGIALMQLVSATVATGGTGCTNSLQTFTVSGGTLGTTGVSATITGTPSGGVLSGALTVTVNGSYLPGTSTNTLLAAATASLTGGGCATAPTITPVWGVGTISMAGYGIKYPTSVTASLSGGNATLSAPTVTLSVPPLTTTIASYISPTQVTTTDAAGTTLSSASQIVTWGHLDDTGFQAAWANAVTRWNAGQQPVIYMPANTYMISQALPTFFKTSASILGDGRFRTYLKLTPTYPAGPVFSFSECWFGGNAYIGPTVAPTQSQVGPQVQGLTVVGDISGPNEQDALVFYDRNDNVLVRDFYTSFLYGHGIQVGATLNQALSYMRESRFDEVYFDHTGGPNIATVDLNATSAGSTGGTVQLTVTGMNMWDDLGPGVIIHNNIANKPAGNMRFMGLRIEAGFAGYTGDALQIGDASEAGEVDNIYITDLTINVPSGTSNAIDVYAVSGAKNSSNINVYGGLINNAGGVGLNLQSGANMNFNLAIGSYGYNVATGGSVVGPVKLTSGLENTYTYNIGVTNVLFAPMLAIGGPGSGSNIQGTIHDGSATGGNDSIGTGAIDLELSRATANQIASGVDSVLIGGANSTISGGGQDAVVLGCVSCTASASFSVLAGNQVQDGSNYGFNCYGTGRLAANGDNQTCFTVLRALTTSTSPTQLTADLAAAGTANCANSNSAGAFATDIQLTAYDSDTPANTYSWYAQGLLNRTGGVGTTAWQNDASPKVFSTGSVGGVAVAVTADTTHGCPNIQWTAPNSDHWHVGARVTQMRIH